MLISQIQSNRNARFPESVDFGVAALRVAEEAAKGFGFDRVVLYNAKNHPLFYEHPETKSQLERELAMVFDCSAKKLGYDYLDVKDIIKENKLNKSYDKKRRTYIVDVKELNNILIKIIK